MDKIPSNLPLEEYLQSLFKHSGSTNTNTSNNKSEIDTAVELATILHNDQKNQTTKDDTSKLALKDFVKITAKLYQLLLRNQGAEQLYQTYSPIWNWLVHKLNNYEKFKSELAKLESDHDSNDDDNNDKSSTINIPQLLYVTLLICCQLRYLYDKENEEKTTNKFNTAVTIIRKLVKSDAEFASDDYGVISTSAYLSKITKNVKSENPTIKPGRGRGVFTKKRSDSLAPEVQNIKHSESTEQAGNLPPTNKILHSQKIAVLVKQVESFGIEKEMIPTVKDRFVNNYKKISSKAWLKLIEAFLTFPKQASNISNAVKLAPQICQKYRQSEPESVKMLLIMISKSDSADLFVPTFKKFANFIDNLSVFKNKLTEKNFQDVLYALSPDKLADQLSDLHIKLPDWKEYEQNLALWDLEAFFKKYPDFTCVDEKGFTNTHRAIYKHISYLRQNFMETRDFQESSTLGIKRELLQLLSGECKPKLTESVRQGTSLVDMVTRIDQSISNSEFFISIGEEENASKHIYVAFRAVSGLLTGVIHNSGNDTDFAKLMPGIFTDTVKDPETKKEKNKLKNYTNEMRWVPGKGPMVWNANHEFCENLLFQISNLHRMAYTGWLYVTLLLNNKQVGLAILTARSISDVFDEIKGFEQLALKFQLLVAQACIIAGKAVEALKLIKIILDTNLEKVVPWDCLDNFFKNGIFKGEDEGELVNEKKEAKMPDINYDRSRIIGENSNKLKSKNFEFIEKLLIDTVPEFYSKLASIYDIKNEEDVKKTLDNISEEYYVGSAVVKQYQLRRLTDHLYRLNFKPDFDNLKIEARKSTSKIKVSTPTGKNKPNGNLNAPNRKSNRLLRSLRSKNQEIDSARKDEDDEVLRLETVGTVFKTRVPVPCPAENECSDSEISYSSEISTLKLDSEKLKIALKYAKGLCDVSSVRILCSYAIQAGINPFENIKNKKTLKTSKINQKLSNFELLDYQKHLTPTFNKKLVESVNQMHHVTVALSIMDQTYDQHNIYLNLTRFISKETFVENLSSNFVEYCETHDKEPLAEKIEANLKLGRASVFKDMEEIIDENAVTLKIKDKKQYWKRRVLLDKKLKNLLKNGLCENIFQIWRCLLINPSNTSLEYVTKIAGMLLPKESNDDTPFYEEPSSTMIFILASCLDIWHAEEYNASEKSQVILQIYKYFKHTDISENHLIKIYGKFNQYKRTQKPQKQRAPLCLVLDHDLHTLPIEKSDFLTKKYEIISRMFSLADMVKLYMRDEEDEVFDLKAMECFVDPNENLGQTQARMSTWFMEIFKRPSGDDILKPLVNGDPMLYCGHGGGTSFINKKEERIAKGLPILMGCSSARLNDQSFTHFKSRKGISYNKALKYVDFGCPALLGCLWDVTDKDIDLFTMEWIDGLMKTANGESLHGEKKDVSRSSILNISSCFNGKDKSQKEKEKKEVRIGEDLEKEEIPVSPMDGEVLERARKACTLKNLNGSSLIMYGLPSIQFVNS